MLLGTLRALVYDFLKKLWEKKKTINFFGSFFMFFMRVMSKFS